LKKKHLSSSSESDLSAFEQEGEEQAQIKSNEFSPVVIPKSKRISSTTNAAQKVSVDDIPPKAKQVLFILKQAKKLVKYVKVVSVQNIYFDIFPLIVLLDWFESTNKRRGWCYSSSVYRCEMVVSDSLP
jgi:hypothetical protein